MINIAAMRDDVRTGLPFAAGRARDALRPFLLGYADDGEGRLRHKLCAV